MLKLKHKNIVPMQALVRGHLQRVRYKVQLFQYRKARDIQRVWRGHLGRQWFRYLVHKNLVAHSAAIINRVYRYAVHVSCDVDAFGHQLPTLL